MEPIQGEDFEVIMMCGLPGRPFPEFSLLKTVGQNLLQSDSPAVKRFTLDILNRVSKPVVLCDGQGQPLYQNEAFTSLARGLKTAVWAELDPMCRELNRILDTGFPVLQFRDRVQTVDGSWVPVLLDVYPVTDECGHRLGALILATDVTGEENTIIWREQMSFVMKRSVPGSSCSIQSRTWSFLTGSRAASWV
jgi:hypothetical protein